MCTLCSCSASWSTAAGLEKRHFVFDMSDMGHVDKTLFSDIQINSVNQYVGLIHLANSSCECLGPALVWSQAVNKNGRVGSVTWACRVFL